MPERKKTLLLFNLAVDDRDPVLGFATGLIARIAAETEAVHVITVRKGVFSLPANVFVRSVGRERGVGASPRVGDSPRVGRIASVIAFYRHLFAIIRAARIDVCFSHMNPLFVVFAAPVLALRGIPVIMWYSHRDSGLIVKIAHLFSWRVVTSAPEAYEGGGRAVLSVGHMIDTNLFCPAAHKRLFNPRVFLSVGRIAPVKDLITFIRAAGIVRDNGYAFRCVCVGPTVPHDTGYHALLRAEIRRLSLNDIFSFALPVAYNETIPYYQSAFAHVNLCATGSLDKAALEAMACGTVSIFANTAYLSITGMFSNDISFLYGDYSGLARVMIALLQTPTRQLDVLRISLRNEIIFHHSMDSFMRQFMRLLKTI